MELIVWIEFDYLKLERIIEMKTEIFTVVLSRSIGHLFTQTVFVGKRAVKSQSFENNFLYGHTICWKNYPTFSTWHWNWGCGWSKFSASYSLYSLCFIKQSLRNGGSNFTDV